MLYECVSVTQFDVGLDSQFEKALIGVHANDAVIVSSFFS